MSQAEALTRLRANRPVFRVILWGEDPVSDDILRNFGSFPTYANVVLDPRLPPRIEEVRRADDPRVWASTRGLEYYAVGYVSPSRLNEDWGQDEIYADVDLLRPDGPQARPDLPPEHRPHGVYGPGSTALSAESNRVYRSF